MARSRIALFAACLLAFLGCTQTRTVTVPAGQSTINAVTDTVRLGEYPPVDLQGSATMPEVRTLIDDTASGAAISVQRVEVDRRPDEGQVRMLWERGQQTVRDEYEMPVYGEMLVWRPSATDRRGYPVRSTPTDRPRDTPSDTATPDTVYRPAAPPIAEIIGSPTEQKVQADVSSIEPPWYRKLWAQARMLLAFVAGAFASYVVVKLVPGL